jgi:hypothetical protein
MRVAVMIGWVMWVGVAMAQPAPGASPQAGPDVAPSDAAPSDAMPSEAPSDVPPPPPPPPPPAPARGHYLDAPSVEMSSSLNRRSRASRMTAPEPAVVSTPEPEVAPTPAPSPGREQVAPGHFLPLRPARFTFALTGGSASLQTAAANRERIADSGPALHLGAGLLIFDIVSLSVSGGVAFPDDYASFSQVVVPENGGDAMTASSVLSVSIVTASIGLRTPFLSLGVTDKGTVAGAAFVDYGGGTFGGHRSIDHCRDCDSSSFDLGSGAFWRVGVDLIIPMQSLHGSWGFTASYQRYLGDAGLAQEIRFGLTGWAY